MKIFQRQIVELNFRFPPDGKNLVHPCIVLSNDEINELEEGFVAVVMTSQERYRDDLYSLEITDNMLNKPMRKSFSAARIHLIGNFLNSDVISNIHSGTALKKTAFQRLLAQINRVTFDQDPYA